MNMEKTTERYPIRYYSMITVAKDFISVFRLCQA